MSLILYKLFDLIKVIFKLVHYNEIRIGFGGKSELDHMGESLIISEKTNTFQYSQNIVRFYAHNF
jgi:hypothetical protein